MFTQKVGLTFFNVLRCKSNILVQNRGFKRHIHPVLREIKKRKDALGPQPPMHRSSMIEWNYSAELFAFSKRLGEDFDSALLQQALTTRDYVISETESQKKVGINQDISLEDNQLMVEKGDKIINKYIPRYLRTVFPKLPEEGIYCIQQYLISEDILSMIGSNIGIGDLILTPENPPSNSTLANVFKAVIASLAESSGLDRANLFIRDFILTQLVGKNVNDLWKIDNPMEFLLDIMERDGKPQVEPRLIGESGRSTILANYRVGLYQNKELIGTGCGESISIAKEMAAWDVLQKMFDTTETMKPIPFNLDLKSDSSEPFANLSLQDWCETNVSKLVKRI